MGQAQSQSMFDPTCDDCTVQAEVGAESLKQGPVGISSAGGNIPGVVGYGNGPNKVWSNEGAPGVDYNNRYGHPNANGGSGPGQTGRVTNPDVIPGDIRPPHVVNDLPGGDGRTRLRTPDGTEAQSTGDEGVQGPNGQYRPGPQGVIGPGGTGQYPPEGSSGEYKPYSTGGLPGSGGQYGPGYYRPGSEGNGEQNGPGQTIPSGAGQYRPIQYRPGQGSTGNQYSPGPDGRYGGGNMGNQNSGSHIPVGLYNLGGPRVVQGSNGQYSPISTGLQTHPMSQYTPDQSNGQDPRGQYSLNRNSKYTPDEPFSGTGTPGQYYPGVGGKYIPNGNNIPGRGGQYTPRNTEPQEGVSYPVQSGFQNGYPGLLGPYLTGSKWPTLTGSFVGPDGLNYICCAVNTNFRYGSTPSGSQDSGGHNVPGGPNGIQYGHESTGSQIPVGQYRPSGTGGQSIGGQYNPDINQYGPGNTGSQGTGGQYSPGAAGIYGPGKQYEAGGGQGNGYQNGPGTTVSGGVGGNQPGVTGGKYGTGGIGTPNTGGQYSSSGTGGPYGSGGPYGPAGQYAPGGQYAGPSATGGQFGPGTNLGQYHPGHSDGPSSGQYGPLSTGSNLGSPDSGQHGPLGSGSNSGGSGSGGQYGPGTGGQYDPGFNLGGPDSGGQYGPIGSGSNSGGPGSGGQYGPGFGGQYGPHSNSGGSGSGGQYGPVGSVSNLGGPGSGGQYGPIGSGSNLGGPGTGGQYGPGSNSGGSGSGGQYGPVGSGSNSGGPGSSGQYGPGSNSGGPGSSRQYGPGINSGGPGSGGKYGPVGSGSNSGGPGSGGQYAPGSNSGGPGSSGQYGPRSNSDGPGSSGQYGPVSNSEGPGSGGKYGPVGSGSNSGGPGSGGQYSPGSNSGGPGSSGQYGPGSNSDGPGSSGQYGPGSNSGGPGSGGKYGPVGSGSNSGGPGSGGQYAPGSHSGGPGSGVQYGPGSNSGGPGSGGQYGPGINSGDPGSGGPYVPGNKSGGPGSGGQYGPVAAGSNSGGPGSGGLYGPISSGSNSGGPGSSGQYTPGSYPDGPGSNGQYERGTSGGQYGPGGSRWPGQYGTDNQMGGDNSQIPPQNVVDPNSISSGDDSEAEASVSQAANGTVASASSKGGNDKGHAQTHVTGTYTGSGSFSAQAEITGDNKAANSQVNGDKKGASSTAQGSGRNSKSQANVKLGSETGSVLTGSQSEGLLHSSNSQVQGSVKGGMADAQAKGPGSTSSQAQIGFTPYKDGDKTHDLQKTAFVGGGISSAQSNGRTGMSQSQLHGTFKYGITYNGAAQSGASLDKDAVFPNRLPFDKIDVFDENNKNINVNEGDAETSDKIVYLPTLPTPADITTEVQNTDVTTEVNKDEVMNNSDGVYGPHTHADHHTLSDSSAITRAPPVESKRSFPTYGTNSGDYDYPTDKDDNPPDDYDIDDGFGNDIAENERGFGINTSYNEFSRDADLTHQPLQNTKRKGVEVRQTTGGNTQHILLGSLTNQDAVITQKNSERPDESRIYQPGERIPGTGGYTIPRGFTGSVKSVASKDKTYVIGSKESPSQAQSVALTPGSGKVKYNFPPYGRNVQPKDLRSLYDPRSDESNRYVSISKSVTRDLDNDNNIRKQYSHTYYTKSSSCGYFTFTCTMVSSAEGKKRVCKPKVPLNPDGTPMRC